MAMIILSYYKIRVVCLSITEGQWKRFDLEAQEAVSLAIEHSKLDVGDLREWQS